MTMTEPGEDGPEPILAGEDGERSPERLRVLPHPSSVSADGYWKRRRTTLVLRMALTDRSEDDHYCRPHYHCHCRCRSLTPILYLCCHSCPHFLPRNRLPRRTRKMVRP